MRGCSHEAQRAANLSEYDRLLAAVATAGDNGWFVMTIEDLLRAVAAGDTARAAVAARQSPPAAECPG